MKDFHYKGFIGSVDVDHKDGLFFGKLLFINDLVTYHADNYSALKSAFEESVDDYLTTCEELGREPQKPFKGSFNIRIDPELHKQLAVKAHLENKSLNEAISEAVKEYLSTTSNETVVQVVVPSGYESVSTFSIPFSSPSEDDNQVHLRAVN